MTEAMLRETPSFAEARLSMAAAHNRLKRQADGDRERVIVQQLNREAPEKQPKGNRP